MEMLFINEVNQSEKRNGVSYVAKTMFPLLSRIQNNVAMETILFEEQNFISICGCLFLTWEWDTSLWGVRAYMFIFKFGKFYVLCNV